VMLEFLSLAALSATAFTEGITSKFLYGQAGELRNGAGNARRGMWSLARKRLRRQWWNHACCLRLI
jgi:hypothetical protein